MDSLYCKLLPTYTFYGPPGSGKGTQGIMIQDRFSFLHLSSGDILRKAIEDGDPTALEVKGIMERGELVPDELISKMVHDSLKLRLVNCREYLLGVILDGYPRTVGQARMMDDMLLDLRLCSVGMVNLEVPEEEIYNRLKLRAIKEKRADDNEVSIRKRIEEWRKNYEILKGYFSSKYRFFPVEGIGSMEEVQSRVVNALQCTCKLLTHSLQDVSPRTLQGIYGLEM